MFFFLFFSLPNVALVLEGKKGNFRNFGSWEIGKILDFFSRLNLTNFAIFGEEFGKIFNISKLRGNEKENEPPIRKK